MLASRPFRVAILGLASTRALPCWIMRSRATWNALAWRPISFPRGNPLMNGSLSGSAPGSVGAGLPSTTMNSCRFSRSQSIPRRFASLVETSITRASSITCLAGTSMTWTMLWISAITRGLVTTISRLPPRSTWISADRSLSAAWTSTASAYLRSTT